ncbi:HalX domain-containing protein [Halosimplex halophilum]|uniref:HalX domain-containing protein n=1 Tax=Halosimplex halophilum TaxID=2559572 RepID=UPI00107F8C03|nr:HalX domain-containing protein [Halosimplex halophilum]
MTGSNEVVLVVEDDPEIAALYARWLSEEYQTRVAHGPDEALDRLDESVTVVLLDRQLSEGDGESAPDSESAPDGESVLDAIAASEYDPSVALVTAVEPDFDIVDMDIDAYRLKPLTRTELLELVRSLRRRARYDASLSELFSLVSKRAALMASRSDEELRDSDEYRELVARLQTVNARTDDLVRGLSARDVETLFRQLETRRGGPGGD